MENNMQYQRNSNVVITGILPNVEHNDLEDIVIRLFNNVCYHSISSKDIVDCHRLSKKTDNVVVRFMNKKDAIALLNSKDAIQQLNLSEVGLHHCEKLFVQEHLIPYVSGLAYRCRCLKRQNIIEKTKVQKGIVKILFKDENGIFKWINIQHIQDIIEVLPDYA